MSGSKLAEKQIESFLDSDNEPSSDENSDSDVFVNAKKKPRGKTQPSLSSATLKRTDHQPTRRALFESSTCQGTKESYLMKNSILVKPTKSNECDTMHSISSDDSTDCTYLQKENEELAHKSTTGVKVSKGQMFAAKTRKAVFRIFEKYEKKGKLPVSNTSTIGITNKSTKGPVKENVESSTSDSDDDSSREEEKICVASDYENRFVNYKCHSTNSRQNSSRNNSSNNRCRKYKTQKSKNDQRKKESWTYRNLSDLSDIETTNKTDDTSDESEIQSIKISSSTLKSENNCISNNSVNAVHNPVEESHSSMYNDCSKVKLYYNTSDDDSKVEQMRKSIITKIFKDYGNSSEKSKCSFTNSPTAFRQHSSMPHRTNRVKGWETLKNKSHEQKEKLLSFRNMTDSSNSETTYKNGGNEKDECSSIEPQIQLKKMLSSTLKKENNSISNNDMQLEHNSDSSITNDCNNVNPTAPSSSDDKTCLSTGTLNEHAHSESLEFDFKESNLITLPNSADLAKTEDPNTYDELKIIGKDKINTDCFNQTNISVKDCKSQRKRREQNDDSDVKPPKQIRSAGSPLVQELDSQNLSSNKTTPSSRIKSKTLKCHQASEESESDCSDKFENASKNKKSLKMSSASKQLFSDDKLLKVPCIQLQRCGEQWKPKDSPSSSPETCQPDSVTKNPQSASNTPEKVRSPRKINEANDFKSFNESSPSKRTEKTNNISSPEKLLRTRSASKLSSVLSSCSSPRRSARTPKKKTEETPPKLTKATKLSTTLFTVSEEIDENDINKTPSKKLLDFSNIDENDGSISNVKLSTPSPVKSRHISEDKQRTPLSSQKSNRINNVYSPLSKINITVRTPISKKSSRREYLSPSMAKKEHGTCERSEDALDFTRKQLHISTVPKALPCRDSEFNQIESFLTKKIEHSAGGCMYISGVPGTGKTATVHAVIRSLQESVNEKKLPDFDFVEVNGLRLTEPKQAYVRIYQALTDQKLSADQAQQLLNKRFSKNSKKPTIILVDELDYLCNRRQDVVYNILDWPTKRTSKLVVLTISNTMDLPERTLKGRVTSRMGLTRVTFLPYNYHQLMAIVQDRLSDCDTFHPDAVQLVARKVAAVSGDARRALDICRRTTELVEAGGQVTVGHVERALTQIFSGPRVLVIKSLNTLSQLTLRALRDECQRTGVDEATAHDVYKHLQGICSLDGHIIPTTGALLQTIVSLVSLGLIVAEKGRMDIMRKMSLNVSSDDIHYALNNIS